MEWFFALNANSVIDTKIKFFHRIFFLPSPKAKAVSVRKCRPYKTYEFQLTGIK